MIVSVKSYNHDKMQFGVPVNRGSGGVQGSINNIQTRHDEIDMDSVFSSNQSSDNESGLGCRRACDAQRTSAFK